MSFEPTRGDVYCCNNELHCTQCNNCNQTMSVGLKCRTRQEMLCPQCPTIMSPNTMISNSPQRCDSEYRTFFYVHTYSENPTHYSIHQYFRHSQHSVGAHRWCSVVTAISDSCCTSKYLCCFEIEEQAKVHLPSTVQ